MARSEAPTPRCIGHTPSSRLASLATNAANTIVAFSPQYALREFRLAGNKITNAKVSGRWGDNDECTDWIERIVVMGAGGLKVKKLTVEATGRELEFVEENGVLVIRKPELGVTEDWAIVFG